MIFGIDMITKEQFKDLISSYIKNEDRVSEISDVMHVCLFEMDVIDYSSRLLCKILPILFNKYAVDNISWWIWERRDNSSLKMHIDEQEIPSETIDDLWEIVKDDRI